MCATDDVNPHIRKGGPCARDARCDRPVRHDAELLEMDWAEPCDTTLCQEKRPLRRMTVTDAEQADAAFGLRMGDALAPRRAFIIDEDGLLDEGFIGRLTKPRMR